MRKNRASPLSLQNYSILWDFPYVCKGFHFLRPITSCAFDIIYSLNQIITQLAFKFMFYIFIMQVFITEVISELSCDICYRACPPEAITGVVIMAFCHVVQTLPLIWRSGMRSCSNYTVHIRYWPLGWCAIFENSDRTNHSSVHELSWGM